MQFKSVLWVYLVLTEKLVSLDRLNTCSSSLTVQISPWKVTFNFYSLPHQTSVFFKLIIKSKWHVSNTRSAQQSVCTRSGFTHHFILLFISRKKEYLTINQVSCHLLKQQSCRNRSCGQILIWFNNFQKRRTNVNQRKSAHIFHTLLHFCQSKI